MESDCMLQDLQDVTSDNNLRIGRLKKDLTVGLRRPVLYFQHTSRPFILPNSTYSNYTCISLFTIYLTIHIAVCHYVPH